MTDNPAEAPQPWPCPDVVIVAAPQHLVQRVHPDVRINTRTLDNPYNIPILHEKWGLHPDVIKHIRKDPKLNAVLKGIPDEIEELWTTGKTPLPITVLVTCMGAYHRSPAVSVILAEALKDTAFHVEVRVYQGKHRVSETPPARVGLNMQDVLDHSVLHVVYGLDPRLHNDVGLMREDVARLLLKNPASEVFHG